jgi:hypothetical protein
MTAFQAITLGLTAGAGVMSAAGAYQQGQVQKKVAENNAVMAEYAAQDAQRRGEEEAQRVQRATSQLSGRQRGLMASRGLDLGAGTPAEILDQTDFFGETDTITARDNAARDAWAYRAEGQSQLSQGRAAARQGNLEAFSTLLGTAGSVASRWDTYRRPSGGLPDWYTNPANTRYSSGSIGSWYRPR